MSFVFGIISATLGLLCFIIGALPGAILAISGWRLITASKAAERLLGNPQEENAQYDMIDSLASFFTIYGIYTLVGICMMILSVVVIILSASTLSHVMMSMT